MRVLQLMVAYTSIPSESVLVHEQWKWGGGVLYRLGGGQGEGRGTKNEMYCITRGRKLCTNLLLTPLELLQSKMS